MPIISIRVMTPKDITFAHKLVDMAGWGLTRADVERNLHFEPMGCFIASLNGVDVGVVNSYLYGDLGYIGNLVVLPNERGGGVGAALMRKAIERLTSEGVETIRLDSVQRAIPLYKRLGFKPEYWSLRYTGIATQGTKRVVERLTDVDLGEVERLDNTFSGINRGDKIRKIQEEFPSLCFKVISGEQIRGYIMAKTGQNIVRVGPWICNPDYHELAEHLLEALLSEVTNQKIWIGIPDGNTESVKIVEKKGLAPLPPSLRMCYGACRTRERIEGIYAIGAPDKG